MGDVDNTTAFLRMYLFEEISHGGTAAGIKRGKRLIQKKKPGLKEKSPGERHSLLFSSAQVFRHASEKRPYSHLFGKRFASADDIPFFPLSLCIRTEQDILLYGQEREKKAVLIRETYVS
jgi:hypothetical protein